MNIPSFYRVQSKGRLCASLAVVLFAALSMLALGPGLIRSHVASAPCPTTTDIAYSVMLGETLSTIAAAHATSAESLAAYNKIAHPNLIFPFQRVCIPSSSPVGGSPVTLPMPLLPNNPFVATARLDATVASIPVQLFVNQINQESGFNPDAVSSAGAIGIAQFLPSTAAGLNPPIDPHDPNQSLKGAAQLMASYLAKYNGNSAMALGAYNAGPGAVDGAIVRCGAIHFRTCLPDMTQQYIHIITGN